MQQDHKDILEVTKSIFLNIDDEIMEERIKHRAPIGEEELARRLESAATERDLAKQYCTDMLDASGEKEEVSAHVYALVAQYIGKEII